MRGNGAPGNGHYIRDPKQHRATPVFTHIRAIVLATLGNPPLFHFFLLLFNRLQPLKVITFEEGCTQLWALWKLTCERILYLFLCLPWNFQGC